MLVPISVLMSKHSIRSGIVSRPSACWSPSSASTRCWRRRSERSFSWSSASRALRSASSRIRRLSPRSAARISTGPPRRSPSAWASARRDPDVALDDQQRRDHHRARVVLEDERLGDVGDPAAGLVVEVEALAVRQHAVADLEHLGVRLARRRPRRRSHRASRPTRWRPAGAPAASAPRAADCARGRRPRTAARPRPRASTARAPLDLPVAAGEEVRSRRRSRAGSPPCST